MRSLINLTLVTVFSVLLAFYVHMAMVPDPPTWEDVAHTVPDPPHFQARTRDGSSWDRAYTTIGESGQVQLDTGVGRSIFIWYGSTEEDSEEVP